MGETYKFKRKPYHHQVEALKKLLKNGYGGALLMEPRTGKTQVCIDYASIQFLKGRVTRVVIFCPVGVIGVWVDQIKEICPVPHKVLVWDRKSRQYAKLPPYGNSHLDFVIVNYDAFSTPGQPRRNRKTGELIRDGGKIVRSRRGGRFAIKDQLLRWQPDLIILDESHRIKSPSAKKSTALHSFNHVPYRIIATGTVVTKAKRVFDVYSQWKFLNPERFLDPDTQQPMRFGEFKSRYGKWRNRGNYSQWMGNKNEAELHTLIHKDSYSVLRADCYDLPKSTSQVIHVEAQESAEVYDQMAADMIARIKTGEITEASIKLVLYLRLSQITSGITKTVPTPSHPKGRLAVVGSEKLRAIESRLEDLMEADEKVVIGAHFIGDIVRLERMLAKHKIPTFTIRGGMSLREREDARVGFHKVSGGAVFIGQPSASSEGIDLSCASILQWYSLTNSWVHFRQFSDRIALSEKPTFHEFFLMRNTIDELRYQTINDDDALGRMIIQSPERLLRNANSQTIYRT